MPTAFRAAVKTSPRSECGRWIDLSHPIRTAMPVFPGDDPVTIRVTDSTDATTAAVRHLNCSRLDTSVHSGTHMDAPFHFFGDGNRIDQVAPEAFMGDCVCLSVKPIEGVIGAAILDPFEESIRAHPRVLLRTGWESQWGGDRYFQDHPVLDGAAARRLVQWGVCLVGVDTPSVDRPPFPAHLELLGNGLLIVENLTNLGSLPAGLFHFIAIPLRIEGRDGSPVRALAWVND
jgi:kynurenine formamidase